MREFELLEMIPIVTLVQLLGKDLSLVIEDGHIVNIVKEV